jgi:hypothetical protein
MKYTILGFRQEKLVEHGLDLTDALILRELHDFKATGRMVEKTVNGKQMFWVKYSSLIENLPVLGIKTNDSVYRRMMKMVDAGVLEHETLKECGTFSFFAFTPLSDEMQYASDEKSEGYGSKVGGGTDEKSEQKTILSKKTNLPKDSSAVANAPAEGGSESSNQKPNATERGHGDDGSAPRRRFKPPTPEEVDEYCASRPDRPSIPGDEFVDFYASRGWMVGRNKMKDWKAGVRTWENRRINEGWKKPASSGGPIF